MYLSKNLIWPTECLRFGDAAWSSESERTGGVAPGLLLCSYQLPLPERFYIMESLFSLMSVMLKLYLQRPRCYAIYLFV